YHLTNLLLHAGAAVVFYFVALRLLRVAQPAGSETVLRVAAAVTALFFSIHPLRVESVAWATERRDVLSGLWFMLTILFYVRAASASGTERRRWLAASVGCYALAVLSKGIVMTLPVVLIILDVCPLRRLPGNAWRWAARGLHAIWLEKLPFIVLAGVAAAMAIYAGHGIAEPLSTRPVITRIAAAVYGLAFYVRKTIVPFGIWPLYEMPMEFKAFSRPVLASAVAVAALTTIVFLLRHKAPAALAAWLAYIVMVSPVSGLMQSGPQLVAPRYTYLPCLGWALLVGAAVRLIFSAGSRLVTVPLRAGAA